MPPKKGNIKMTEPQLHEYMAFAANRCIASGDIKEVARKTKNIIDTDQQETILVFDGFTGEVIDIDFRGTLEDVLKKLETSSAVMEPAASPETLPSQRGPGRPKMGVVSREVTLLPRHWEWLNRQPGGASVALRKLVEEARRTYQKQDLIRQSREAAYRFVSTLAGNETGYEETIRALFAGNQERFTALTSEWPGDIAEYAQKLAHFSFENSDRIKK